MSRIGQKIIQIPESVSFSLKNGTARISGPQGELEVKIISVFYYLEINIFCYDIQPIFLKQRIVLCSIRVYVMWCIHIRREYIITS